MAFFIINSTDATYDIVKEFLDTHQDEYRKTILWKKKVLKGKQDDQTRFRRDYALFSIVRNTYLKRILREEWDYFYSIDSDVLVPSDSLTRLLSHDKDVISALIHNGVFQGSDYYNVYKLVDGVYRTFQTKYLDQQTQPIRVDVTGACYLIKREVLDAGVRYSYFYQGEDGGFCESATQKGFTLWNDPTIRPIHLLHGKGQTIKEVHDEGLGMI